MRAGIPRFCAAKATARPWLPPEAATTPAAGISRVRRFVKAPRALKEPACCSSSSLRTSGTPIPKSAPSTSTMGVRRIYGRMRAYVARMVSGATLLSGDGFELAHMVQVVSRHGLDDGLESHGSALGVSHGLL